MLRFAILACTLLVGVAYADQQAQYSPDQYARQGFGVQGNAGFGDLGSVQGAINLGLPNTGLSGQNNGFLTSIIMILGLLSFANLVATVVAPLFGGGSGEETEEAETRRKRTLDIIQDQVVNAIAKFAAPNNQ